jgi:hypothetical protein
MGAGMGWVRGPVERAVWKRVGDYGRRRETAGRRARERTVGRTDGAWWDGRTASTPSEAATQADMGDVGDVGEAVRGERW